jgi:hypothetical protein
VRDREAADGWSRRVLQLASEAIRVQEEMARLESRKATEAECALLQAERVRVEPFVRQFQRDLEPRRAEADVHRLNLAAAEDEQSRRSEEAVRLDRISESAAARAREAAGESGPRGTAV